MAIKDVKVCPCCRQPLPIEDTGLTGVQRRIYEEVKAHPGIMRQRLFDRVYANAVDGGPLSINAVSVSITYANRKLRRRGLKIESSSKQMDTRYTVVALGVDA